MHSISKTICILLLFCSLPYLSFSVDTGFCMITLDGKVFSLNFIASSQYYTSEEDNKRVFWNFCYPFKSPEGYNCTDAFSMVIDDDKATCQSYSSDSSSALYNTSLYQNDDDDKTGVVINLNSGLLNENLTKNYTTKIVVICGDSSKFEKKQINFVDNATLEIIGDSSYGCPMIEMNQIWKALEQNSIIFGIVLFGAGILQLFFGRKMLEITIFIAAYCLSFIIFAAISGTFLTPYTAMPYVYLCLLLIIILSSVTAYLALSITYISVFLIGAYMGFIVAILLNSLMVKIFGYTSSWPLIVMSILFALIVGYLTFKIHDQIIILSTSVNGSYMIIRPISWIFGGFPNELLLMEMIKIQQISNLPSTFFIYLFFIIVLAGVGATYQYLKLKREKSDVLEVSRGEQIIQNSVDAIRNSINIIIDKYKRDDDEPSNPENVIEFNDMKKVPLYPDLNNDELSNSAMIREGLLERFQDYGSDQGRKSNESPRVLKQFSYRSSEGKNEVNEEIKPSSQRNSQNNAGNQEKRTSNKSDKYPGFNDKSL